MNLILSLYWETVSVNVAKVRRKLTGPSHHRYGWEVGAAPPLTYRPGAPWFCWRASKRVSTAPRTRSGGWHNSPWGSGVTGEADGPQMTSGTLTPEFCLFPGPDHSNQCGTETYRQGQSVLRITSVMEMFVSVLIDDLCFNKEASWCLTFSVEQIK